MSLFAEEFLELHKNIKLPIILLNTSSVTPSLLSSTFTARKVICSMLVKKESFDGPSCVGRLVNP